MDNVVEILTSAVVVVGILTTLILTLIKSRFDIKKQMKTYNIRELAEDDVKISNSMDSLKERLNADRVQILSFHNGTHYVDGRSSLKFTCTYEVVRAGIPFSQKEFKNIPLSILATYIGTITKDKELISENIEELREDMPATYQLWSNQGIKSFYDVLLHNDEMQPIGILSIQYIDNPFSIRDRNDIIELYVVKHDIEKLLIGVNKAI